MDDWTDTELRSTILAYLEMLEAQQNSLPYSKSETRRRLQREQLQSRSESSIEYRMRNITAVLEQHNHPTIKGYVAAANVGNQISEKIWSIVCESTSIASEKLPPIIYFNVGWMKHYAGPADSDKTIGAHGYLDSHYHGAESYNFLPTENGTVRGYRPPGDREQTNLNRLGASSSQDQIDGVLVIWLAREPGTGRTLIVGWYRNAKVYRLAQDGGIDLNGERIHYSVETRKEDATLLPPVARTYEVSSSRVSPGEGFGQKPTWYGADTVNKRVWAYIQSWSKNSAPQKVKPSKSPPKNHDPELRRKVERAAVEHAKAYYKAIYGNGCPIVSVEKEAKGWDLEVFAEAKPLLVEVKGLLNTNLLCELTPNEYEKMMLPANRNRYVVFVVNNALAEHPAAPVASIFKHINGMTWRTDDGRELVIREKVGAILSYR